MPVTVLELRNYLLKPGRLEHFIEYYEDVLVDLQEAFGMHILAQFRPESLPDRFVFLRGFEDLAQRCNAENAFYNGPVWDKFGPVANSMIEEFHNVRLLRPLGDIDALTRGRSTQTVGAEMAAGVISPQLDAFAIDIYKAAPGQRDALIEQFEAKVVPAYGEESVQVRGLFVGEMGKNEFTRHTAIQDADELTVITAYPGIDEARETRARLAALVEETTAVLLQAEPERLLLSPTMRSTLRYAT